METRKLGNSNLEVSALGLGIATHTLAVANWREKQEIVRDFADGLLIDLNTSTMNRIELEPKPHNFLRKSANDSYRF